MAPFKNAVTTQSDWQQGTLDGVVATAAGDVELAKEPLDPNILANGGFNADLSGWTLAGNPVIDSSVTVEGAASARMDGTGNTTTNVYIYADVPLQAGTTYIVSFWARTQGASKLSSAVDAGPRFRWGVGGDPVLDAPVNYELPADSDWTFYSFIATATAAGAPRIEFSLHDVVAGGKMWVDDVQLRVFGHAASGSRVSPVLDLSPVGIAAGSSISWTATTPAGTSVTVETNLSLDGGQTWGPWQACTNGGAIPGIMSGMDLSNARLQTRVTLSTTNTTVTPQLHDLTLSIGSQVTALFSTSVEVGIRRQTLAGMSVTADVLGVTRTAPTSVKVGVARSLAHPMLVKVGVSRSTLFPLDIEIRVNYPRNWHLRLFDGSGDLISVVDELVAPSYQRRIAQPSPVSFGVPSDHPAARDLSLARSWALYRGAENVASGRIIARNITENPWTYEGLTNEVNLEQIILPSRWGEVYRGWDIADVGRDLLKRRRTFRLNTQAHWQQYMVASSNVDLTSNPGYVMIARYAYQGGLRYHKSASITLQFPDPGDGFAWERIRWSEIVGDVTRIKIQYSTDGGQTWSQEMEATNAEDVQMNEEVGVLLSGQGGSIQVRINLYTDDDTSPFYDEEYLAENPGTQQVYGRTPILTGAELMMSKPGLVQPHPSEFPASAGVTLNSPPDWSEATALEAWQDLYDLFGWEWYVDGDNYLHFAERLGVDRTNEIVLRDGTNTILRGLEDFDDEIVNVGIGRGAGEGFAQLEAVYRHEQSISDHDGVEYTRVVEFPEITDQAALEAKIQEYVNERAYAKPPLEAELVFPTGEEPEIFLGDTVRAVHPRTGTIVVARVMDIRRQLTENGERWQVGLNAQWGSGSLIDQLSRRAPKAREESLSPPSGFSARGVSNGVIELVWQGAPPVQIQHTDRFSVDGAPVEWTDLQQGYLGNRFRHNGLVLASKHAYRIRRVDGRKVSPWVGPVIALAKDADPPPIATGVRVKPVPGGIRVTCDQPNTSDWKVTHCRLVDFQPFSIASSPEYIEGAADLVELPDGDIYAVFQRGPAGSSTRGIYGARLSNPSNIVTIYDGPNDERYPSVIRLANGHLLCAFETTDTTPKSIKVCRSTDNGASWSAPTLVVQESSMDVERASLIQLADGSILCGYRTQEGFGPSKYGIKYVKSTDNGNTWTSPITIYGDGASPSFEQLGDGRILCAFQTTEDGEYTIKILESSDGGVTWGNKRTAVAPVGAPIVMPTIRRLADGRLIVSYYVDTDFTTATTFVSRSTDTEGMIWDEQPIPVSALDTSADPHIVVTSTGRIYCAFHTDAYDPNFDAVYMVSNDDGATWVGEQTEVISAVSGKQTTFRFDNVPLGRWYAAVIEHEDESGNTSLPVGSPAVTAGHFEDVPIEIEHIGGNLTRIDVNGVFLDDADSKNLYAARIAWGIASSGDFIALNWNTTPKVVAAPLSSYTYLAANSANNQRMESVVSNVSPEGFEVYLRVVAEGVSQQQTVNTNLSEGSSWQSGATAIGVREIAVTIRMTKKSHLFARSSALHRHTYRIEYRAEGDPNWTTWGTYKDEQDLFNSSWLINQTITHTRTRTHHITLPPGQWRIRVVFVDWSVIDHAGIVYSSSQQFTVVSWQYNANEVLATGDLLWIAIEGGAEDA